MLAALTVAITLALASAQGAAKPPAACGADAICAAADAEDLIATPDGRFVLASSVRSPSQVLAIDVRTRTVLPLVNGATPVRPDRRRYPDCPGPPDATSIQFHGIGLRRVSSGGADLHVVNHGGREAIEVYRVDGVAKLRATWIGCVPLQSGIMGNGVAPLRDGGLVATNFGAPSPDLMKRIFAGERTGDVRVWRAAGGWRTLPGSAMSGANGVDISQDGRFVFAAASGTRELLRFDLKGRSPPRRVALDFIPDNVRRAPDGSMLVAGYTGSTEAIAACLALADCFIDYAVVTVDPKTMRARNLLSRKASASFGNVATAALVGRALWLGPFRGDRIEIAPLPSGH